MASILRYAARSASRQTRQFSSAVVTRKDFVQDLYIKELKAYTPPVQAKDAHLDQVKQYSPPSAPKAPTLPTDLASELAAYDAAEPHSGVVAATGGAEAGAAGGADAFLAHLEEDIPVEVHHH